MNSDKKWDALKCDMQAAILQGYARGFHLEPETLSGSRFNTFEYVLDLMNRLDACDPVIKHVKER